MPNSDLFLVYLLPRKTEMRTAKNNEVSVKHSSIEATTELHLISQKETTQSHLNLHLQLWTLSVNCEYFGYLSVESLTLNPDPSAYYIGNFAK